MATQAAVYQRNMESAILFMQQEHAKTLKALHEEIQKLQKKCSDLTFQLNMQGLDSGHHDKSDERVKELEAELNATQRRQKELEDEYDGKDVKIKELELMLKKQKMKSLEDIQRKNSEVEHLRAELETKSNNVAYLTTELHKLKRLQLNSSSRAVHSDVQFIPAPPKDNPSRPRRSHQRRNVGDQEELQKHPVRVGSGKSSGSSRSESPTELAKPFLRREESEPRLKFGVQPQPLPPIRSSSGKEGIRASHVIVHKVVPPPHQRTLSRPGTTQEIQTLAVDQVSHSDSPWSHAQSRSSEYH